MSLEILYLNYIERERESFLGVDAQLGHMAL